MRQFFLLLLLLLFGIFYRVSTLADICLKRSYLNGVGLVPFGCEDNEEKNGALCYPKCKPGYYGVGPVCWSLCPYGGYTELGAVCLLNADIYGKGCCCTAFSKNCCGNCRNGYKDDGCTCRKGSDVVVKSSYGRGAGKPMICPKGWTNDAGLCYTDCVKPFGLVGPMCWAPCVSSSKYYYDCNRACASSPEECGRMIGMDIVGIGSLGANSCDLPRS